MTTERVDKESDLSESPQGFQVERWGTEAAAWAGGSHELALDRASLTKLV